MLVAQLIASHNAAMECYERAMLRKQNFDGRHENLKQATKLSRTYAALTEALDRHCGKGQQRITVEHVHVHAGAQAIVGAVTSTVPCLANFRQDGIRTAAQDRHIGSHRLTAGAKRIRTLGPTLGIIVSRSLLSSRPVPLWESGNHHFANGEPKVRIHLPPAESPVRTGLL